MDACFYGSPAPPEGRAAFLPPSCVGGTLVTFALTGCVTLGELLNLSDQFNLSHL